MMLQEYPNIDEKQKDGKWQEESVSIRTALKMPTYYNPWSGAPHNGSITGIKPSGKDAEIIEIAWLCRLMAPAMHGISRKDARGSLRSSLKRNSTTERTKHICLQFVLIDTSV